MYNKVARCESAEAIVMHFTKRQKYFFVFVLTLTRLLRIQSPALYEQQLVVSFMSYKNQNSESVACKMGQVVLHPYPRTQDNCCY